MSFKMEDILLQVNKPARYIGEEWNISRKDFTKANVRFALCFPDLYEVGMSNLGVRIIYSILNNIADVCCERCFSPDTDMEKELRRNNLEIFSLESKRSLREFDFIGFSLGSELNYTNVLNILDLGNIPLQAALRDNRYPIVIGGGPCTMNPEPMWEFFDMFIIGEAEGLIQEIINIYRKFQKEYKTSKVSKQELLFRFSQLEGVYAPSFYEARYAGSGATIEFKPIIKDVPARIRKYYLKGLNLNYVHLNWIIPYIQIIHDRVISEIMRGCPNRCRFCQARSQYFPLRIKNMDNILEVSTNLYKNTGYEEISLGGLSVSDYPNIEILAEKIINLFKAQKVSVSLPSIKAKENVGDISASIAKVKKTGLTFAPEAGSEKLRNILAKDFNTQDFFGSLEKSFLSGYQHLKLYFMIGLPYENNSDLDSIIDLSTQASRLGKKVKGSAVRVNISINAFIPKPHTPLQWFNMDDIESLKGKQNYLKQKNYSGKLRLNFHNYLMSFIEGILSRGDRKLSRVILSAFQKGARFDAWDNYFMFNLWQEAFSEASIDPYFYLRRIGHDELLPWDFLDVGISKESLLSKLSELNKTIA
jgi:radical SAM family uncharacterized protein